MPKSVTSGPCHEKPIDPWAFVDNDAPPIESYAELAGQSLNIEKTQKGDLAVLDGYSLEDLAFKKPNERFELIIVAISP